MFRKNLFSFTIAIALLFSAFGLPVPTYAQSENVCGVFMANSGSKYLDFGILNDRIVSTTVKEKTFQELFGRPFDGSTYMLLYGVQWADGKTAIIGYSGFDVVSNCYDAIPIQQAQPTQPPPPTQIPPVLYFYSDQTQISLGNCTVLFWQANEAYSQVFLSADDNSDPGGYNGPAPLSGNAQVCPGTNTLYRLSGLRGNNIDTLDVVISVVWPSATFVPTTLPTVAEPTALPTQPNTPAPAEPASPAEPAQLDPVQLSITAIDQRVHSDPILLTGADGRQLKDNGDYDCLVASTAMALAYFKDQGVLTTEEAPEYRALVPMMRKQTPPSSGLFPSDVMIDHPILPQLTHDKIKASYVTVDADKAYAFIRSEINAGRPLIGLAAKMGKLAQGASGEGHAILITGVRDGKVLYNDPWGGANWEMSIESFTAAEAVYGYFTFSTAEIGAAK